MNSILLKSDSSSDLDLIVALAKKLGIKIERLSENYHSDSSKQLQKATSNHNFFDSAGLWKDRNLDAKSLRRESWQIQD